MIKEKTMALSDIVITEQFKKSAPKAEKIHLRYATWKRTGEVPGTIYVDEENELVDGYAAYLVHRMVGTEEVKVVRINRQKALVEQLMEERDYYKCEADTLAATVTEMLNVAACRLNIILKPTEEEPAE